MDRLSKALFLWKNECDKVILYLSYSILILKLNKYINFIIGITMLKPLYTLPQSVTWVFGLMVIFLPKKFHCSIRMRDRSPEYSKYTCVWVYIRISIIYHKKKKKKKLSQLIFLFPLFIFFLKKIELIILPSITKVRQKKKKKKLSLITLSLRLHFFFFFSNSYNFLHPKNQK